MEITAVYFEYHMKHTDVTVGHGMFNFVVLHVVTTVL